MTSRSGKAHGTEVSAFLIGLARGGAGAMLFALPMLMTMEMWYLGIYMDRDRLLLLMVVNCPLLVLLSHRLGFERTVTWRQALRDAVVAYAIGILASAAILTLFGVLKGQMSVDTLLGKIAVQSVPASIGALLGRSQLGDTSGGDEQEDDSADRAEQQTGYATELFMMAVGALFLSLNVAPTEEMILISYKMSDWHALVMIIASIALMHAFVYALSFVGGHALSPQTPGWHALVRFTMPGYGIALTISFYTLWTFERLDDQSALMIAMSVIVLGLPAALGAAAARLIL